MKTFIIIDANALIHRCFHALPPFTTKDGRPSGALYGLSSILIKILHPDKKTSADGINGRLPDYIVAFFDRPEPTFRKEIYKEYKIHRPKAPDELISQIIETRNLFNAFGVKTFEIPGFEGDDLIGTAVEKFKNIKDVKIIILTGDADALQLVENNKVVVETFKKGISDTIIYNEDGVKNKYGILPIQLADYKGLVGDQSDNIKGVAGIGPKTASQIIGKYDNLENFLENGQNEKSYAKISENREIALLSKKLSIIRRDAPLEINNIEELKYSDLPKEKIITYFESLGFQSLIKRIK
ncbi:MAG: 5'-3' exonuclease H3TH domain-containing protein [Patescibacteria group bacterium]